MKVSLLLQPGILRSRSMLLYAQRLEAHVTGEPRLELVRLPTWGGPLARQIVDVVVPPAYVPRIEDGIAHIVDHAHAGYLRFLRVPGVVTVHDLIPLKVMAGSFGAGTRRLMSRGAGLWFRWNVSALRHAARLVAPSHATVEELRRWIGDLPVEVVPHGIDPQFRQPADPRAVERARRILAPLEGRRFLLQVTNGFFTKNEIGFAKTFSLLAQRYRDLAWVRVGAPMAPALRPAPDPGRFLYYAEPNVDELVALYRMATLLLFPSLDEGFGWPPLEAMAAGCPVVVSDRGALAETAAPGGLVVDPADPESMAREVGRVLDSHELAGELIERGHSHAERFRWSRAAQRMAELYSEVRRCA